MLWAIRQTRGKKMKNNRLILSSDHEGCHYHIRINLFRLPIDYCFRPRARVSCGVDASWENSSLTVENLEKCVPVSRASSAGNCVVSVSLFRMDKMAILAQNFAIDLYA